MPIMEKTANRLAGCAFLPFSKMGSSSSRFRIFFFVAGILTLRKWKYFPIFDTMRTGFVFCLLFACGKFFAQEIPLTKLLSPAPFETWKTVEVGLLFPEKEREYRMFFNDNNTGKNPYITTDIWLQFTCNGEKYYRPAFYYEDGIPDLQKNKFITEASEWPWRVRFSPPIEGTYECQLLIGADPKTASPKSTGIQFEVKKGNRHGILHTTKGSPYLSFTDGAPFFVLGQNIAWCDSMLNGMGPVPDLHPVYQSGYYQMFHYMHNLADNGGNYVRICLAPWSFAIDNKSVNVYAQDKAFVIDSIIHLAEERGLYVHFVIQLTNSYFANIPRSEWHPIRLAYQKDGMVAADLLKDSAALAAFDNHVRYVHSRWAYSANVAVLEVLPEHYNWEGYKEHKQNFSDYLTHVAHQVRDELFDTLHMINTGARPWDADICRNPLLSFVDIHQYDYRFWANRNRYFDYHRKTEKYDKPFLFGEMGIAGGKVNACDPDDWEYCNDISMHNGMWATTFQGMLGPGLYWWQWHNDSFREANYKPLRWFIDSVANGMSSFTDADMWTGNGLETYYCRTRTTNVVGWVHNTSNWWGNITDSCRDRSGKQMLMPVDDDKTDTVEPRIGNTFVIDGLASGQRYRIVFYDTRQAGKEISSKIAKSSIFGRLRLGMPVNTDCAFRLHRFEYSVF